MSFYLSTQTKQAKPWIKCTYFMILDSGFILSFRVVGQFYSFLSSWRCIGPFSDWTGTETKRGGFGRWRAGLGSCRMFIDRTFKKLWSSKKSKNCKKQQRHSCSDQDRFSSLKVHERFHIFPVATQIAVYKSCKIMHSPPAIVARFSLCFLISPF